MIMNTYMVFKVVPPCGGHHIGSRERGYRIHVSSRAPVWGASKIWRPNWQRPSSFKSCPRVGGILGPGGFHILRLVSSRAPVWGASRLQRCQGMARAFQVVPPCGGHQKVCSN